MSFTPLVPFSGTVGWKFLQRTQERQQETFEKSPQITRNAEAFRERIASIGSAKELVADRQLLEVALGAFGLDDDINGKALIEKVLDSNPDDKKSLAVRFADKRYLALAQAFGFGNPAGARNAEAGFADRILESYKDRGFEVAVGEQDQNMRLAMGLERELETITSQTKLSQDAQWFSVMASPPLRAVFETAFGIPKSVGAIDLDQQLTIFKDRAERYFGTSKVSDFADPEKLASLRDRFLLYSDLESFSASTTSPGSIALTLLSAGRA